MENFGKSGFEGEGEEREEVSVEKWLTTYLMYWLNLYYSTFHNFHFLKKNIWLKQWFVKKKELWNRKSLLDESLKERPLFQNLIKSFLK